MANREGRKTVAAELPDELYAKLAWAIGKRPELKRMSDVLRLLLTEGFEQTLGMEYRIEQRKQARAAKKATA